MRYPLLAVTLEMLPDLVLDIVEGLAAIPPEQVLIFFRMVGRVRAAHLKYSTSPTGE